MKRLILPIGGIQFIASMLLAELLYKPLKYCGDENDISQNVPKIFTVKIAEFILLKALILILAD